jgi:hypothetical protein
MCGLGMRTARIIGVPGSAAWPTAGVIDDPHIATSLHMSNVPDARLSVFWTEKTDRRGFANKREATARVMGLVET